LLDGQVQLGGQATARASEPVIARLDIDTAGRFDLKVPFFRAPARAGGPGTRWSRR
jgi:hypothetical protein